MQVQLFNGFSSRGGVRKQYLLRNVLFAARCPATAASSSGSLISLISSKQCACLGHTCCSFYVYGEITSPLSIEQLAFISVLDFSVLPCSAFPTLHTNRKASHPKIHLVAIPLRLAVSGDFRQSFLV